METNTTGSSNSTESIGVTEMKSVKLPSNRAAGIVDTQDMVNMVNAIRNMTEALSDDGYAAEEIHAFIDDLKQTTWEATQAYKNATKYRGMTSW